MNRKVKALVSGLVILASLTLTVQNADAALRRFYWTADSQSNAYDRITGQQECFANAEAEAYPYAYNTCVQTIGYSCEYANVRVEYRKFGGRPGLYSCQVRVWVEAFE